VLGGSLSLVLTSLRAGEGDAFPKELEEDYQQYIAPEKIRSFQLACILVILLSLPFALVDILALPKSLAHAWLIRGCCFVMAISFYRATSLPQFLSYYRLLSVCLFVSVGVTIEILVAISDASEAARTIYSNGVLLPIMAMYSLSFLSARISFVISVVFLGVYVVIAFGIHDAIGESQLGSAITNSLLLGSAALVGLFSKISRDVYERQAFLRRRALDNELDATERARQLSEHFSNHDALTGLANRKAFERRVSELLRHFAKAGPDVAILFIDLDGFKPVNDRYGHAVGDKLLQAIGQRISNCLSDQDCVARIGGDEFVVALRLDADRSNGERMDGDTAAQLAQSVAERLVQQISRPISVESGQNTSSVVVSVGASVGVSVASLHACDPILLIAIADHAMYQAKRNGKGAACLADPQSLGVELTV
jgi:diguanylate cyclase (GGDEF)-like protein